MVFTSQNSVQAWEMLHLKSQWSHLVFKNYSSMGFGLKCARVTGTTFMVREGKQLTMFHINP